MTNDDISFTEFVVYAILILSFMIGFILHESNKVCTSSPEVLEEQLSKGGCMAYKDYFNEP